MGKNWAIVVGINTYNNLQSLNYAKRDASVMATWFQQEAKFDQVFLFTEDSPPIAANTPIPTQPTFGHLRRFLRAQFENIQPPLLKPEDNLWFFFAGHGNRYKDKDYLMFSDSDPGDVEHTAISVDYVIQRLRRSGAENVVLFLDACRDESSRAGLGIGEQSYQGVITFYSCTANQKSWEIDELQHGSFTHSLLEGLRLQGEANCATVERLAQYLHYQVPHLNTRYGKPAQNPYLQAEPPYKMYFILLEQTATLRDVEPLKYQASQAENKGDLSLAKQLWVRVLAASRGDWDVIEAIERIALRQRVSFELTIAPSEPVTSSSGGRSVTSSPSAPETAQESQFAQREEEHQQDLVRYQQAFSEAIKREFPLSEATRNQLKQLQQSLQLSNNEISQIEQPLVTQKQAEYERRQEERLCQQQEAEYQQKLQQYEQELIKTVEAGNSLDSYQVRQRLRQLQRNFRLKDTDIAAIEARVVASRRPVKPPPKIQQPSPAHPSETTPLRINRKQFLKYPPKRTTLRLLINVLLAGTGVTIVVLGGITAFSMTLLIQATKLAENGMLKEAVFKAAKVPSYTPLTNKSHQLIDQWSMKLLQQATDKYSKEGKLKEAIAMIEVIPVSSTSSRESQSRITQWNKEYQVNLKAKNAATTAIKEKRWQDAINAANKVKTPYWENQVAWILEEANSHITDIPSSETDQNNEVIRALW